MAGTHGSINRCGKVRKQTPKVDQKDLTHKTPNGRAGKRKLFNKRINFST